MYDTPEDIRVRALELAVADSMLSHSSALVMFSARMYAKFISTGEIPGDHVGAAPVTKKPRRITVGSMPAKARRK